MKQHATLSLLVMCACMLPVTCECPRLPVAAAALSDVTFACLLSVAGNHVQCRFDDAFFGMYMHMSNSCFSLFLSFTPAAMAGCKAQAKRLPQAI